MSDPLDRLDEAADAGTVGVTLYRTQSGEWQAAVTADRVSWRVEIAATPSAALARLFRTPDEDIFG